MQENNELQNLTYKHKTDAFARLLKIMDELRAGCPWDKVQTLESLRHLTIEEVYELSDAILEKDMDGIKKELGDLMLHLVFYAKIGSETNDFDIAAKLTEIMLLTNIAVISQQVNKTLEYDAANMKISNLPEANDYFHYEYRKGWEL